MLFKSLKEDSDYLIYEDGRLFSKKTNRFLVGKIDNVGYRVYALALTDQLSVSNHRKSKMLYAHRLVAEYFISNPNNLPYVDHIDRNRLNNHYSNLRWVTSAEDYQNKDVIIKKQPKYYEKDLPDEKWKIFPLNMQYSISNLGRIKNNRTSRLLHLDINGTYPRITLQINKQKVHYYVHRLVYCTFHNDFNLKGFIIDHIDGNPLNCKLSNLQKITQQENCLKKKK